MLWGRGALGGVIWPGAGVVARSLGAVFGSVVLPGVVAGFGLHAGIAATMATRQSKTNSLFIVFSFHRHKKF